MYYILRKKEGGKHFIIESSNDYIDMINDENDHGNDVHGSFGVEAYAEIWRDYYNEAIDRDELKRRLH